MFSWLEIKDVRSFVPSTTSLFKKKTTHINKNKHNATAAVAYLQWYDLQFVTNILNNFEKNNPLVVL